MSSGDHGGLGSVVALGAHILDILGRPVESIPPGQGSALVEEIRLTAAGTAAGAAVDLAKLGARVRSVGAIGDDLAGDMVTAALARHGVDTSGLVRKAGLPTSATILPIRQNGERPALHLPGATPALTLADIDVGMVNSCQALLIGAPDALGAQAAGWLPELTAAARAAGALVVVDVLGQGSPTILDRIRRVLAATDWFCPNSDQLRALTGRADLDLAIKDVLALGTRGVAVTLGDAGCLVTAADGRLVRVPAIRVRVVDTTGCGDGFNAGLLAGLLLGADPVDAAWLGVACGALVATGLGSDAGIADLDGTIEFLSRHEAGVAARIVARIAAAAAARIAAAAAARIAEPARAER
jgi:sugar/nucleoside kinase (ribokinase family)